MILRIVAIWIALASAAGADPQATVRAASDLLAEARAAMADADGERDRLRAFGQAVRAYDAALVASAAGLEKLAVAERALAQDARARRARLNRAIGSLTGLSAVPRGLAVSHPDGKMAALRAGLLLGRVAPVLQEDLAQVEQDLGELETLHALQRAARDDIAAALQEVKAARTALLSTADGRPGRVDRSARAARLDRMGRDASSLEALAVTVENFARQSNLPAVLLLGDGDLDWPIAGDLMRGFEEPDAAGVTRPGIVLQAPSLAAVTAPLDAEVAFAGPFLDNGHVVILQPSKDILLALNGLGVAFVETGDRVSAGDALGMMGGEDTGDEEFLIERASSDSAFLEESLYIELRIDGIATDPAPFFATDAGRER